MIKLNCPHCNQLLQIPEQYAGQTGACKHCQKKLTVPELAGDLLVDAPARPEAVRRRKWKPFAAGGAVAAVLALGIYLFVSRDASPPAATSPEAPVATSVATPSVQRIIEFPTDRAVGELRLREVGNPWWGSPIGTARGSFLVPDGKEVSLAVSRRDSADLAFLQALAPEDLYKLELQPTSAINGELGNIEHLTGLKELWIEYGDLTDTGFRSVRGLSNLEFIYVYGTRISDSGLADLSGLSHLKGLSLGRTKITHRGIQTLKSLPVLERLWLSGTVLTQSMVHALKEIPGLTMLYIDSGLTHASNRIGGSDGPTRPDSIALLGEVTQLRTLVLRGKLHDDSLTPPLSQLAHLNQIEFFDTSVTPAGRNELRRALPNCTITPQDPLVSKSAEGPRSEIEVAQQLAINGKYREAVQAFEKVRAENPDAVEGIDGIHFATAYAALDDSAAHERLCRWLLDRSDQTSSPMDAYRAAKSYVLYSRSDDAELLAKSLKLTQYAVDEGSGGVLPWFNVAHGMANFRLERYAEAGTWLEKSIAHKEPKIRSLALAYSALVDLAQGNEVSAHDFLTQAKQAVTQIRKQDWRDAEIANLALREAEALFSTATIRSSVSTDTVQYLPATTLEAFTVFMRDHGVGNDPNGAFKLVDGVLVVSGAEVGMLFTNEAYENYRLEVDYKWLSDREDRDSGIFVNILGRDGAEQMPSADMRAIEVNILGPTAAKPDRLSGQIWLFSPNRDTVNLTVGGKVFTKRKTAARPLEDLENPLGEWNTMIITSAHGKFSVTLNGDVAVDGTDPVPSGGKIVLQSGRGEIHFGRMVVTPLG